MNYIDIFRIVIELSIGVVQLFVFGFATYYLIKSKGYRQNWFWFGFFFGLIALITAAFIKKREKLGVRLPQYNISEVDRTRINDYFYKLHLFKVPYLIVGSFTMIIEVSLVGSLLATPYIYGNNKQLWKGVGDLLKDELIIAGIIIGVLIVAGLIILGVKHSWKKEDSVEELVYQAQKAKLLDKYTANNYLEMVSVDTANTEFRCTYCGITDKFINGIVLTNEILAYPTIAIPRDRITKIVFDLRTVTHFVSGHLTTSYSGGINVYLDNGEIVILNYGARSEVKKMIEALSQIGIKTESIR